MRRYDMHLPREAETALLEAGGWPVLSVEPEKEDGLTIHELIWFVPIQDYDLVAFAHYRTWPAHGKPELIAVDHQRFAELSAGESPWNDPALKNPPAGWSWFADWIIQWRG